MRMEIVRVFSGISPTKVIVLHQVLELSHWVYRVASSCFFSDVFPCGPWSDHGSDRVMCYFDVLNVLFLFIIVRIILSTTDSILRKSKWPVSSGIIFLRHGHVVSKHL